MPISIAKVKFKITNNFQKLSETKAKPPPKNSYKTSLNISKSIERSSKATEFLFTNKNTGKRIIKDQKLKNRKARFKNFLNSLWVQKNECLSL